MNKGSLLTYIQLKRRQCINFCKETSIVYLIMAAGLYTLLCYILFSEPSLITLTIIIGFSVVVVRGVHQKRNDMLFGNMLFHRFKHILMLEYICILLFFMWPLFFSSQFYLALFIPILSALFVTHTKSSIKIPLPKLSFITKVLPPRHFEWKAGIAKQPFVFIFLMVGLVASLFFPYVTLALIWFFTLYTSSFYSYCEPRYFITKERTSVNQFIQHKLKRELTLYLLIIVPIVCLQIIHQPSIWWATLTWFVLNTMIYSCSILFKYHSYFPDTDISDLMANNTILYLSPVIIFFIPLPFLYFFQYYAGAKKKLKAFLHVKD